MIDIDYDDSESLHLCRCLRAQYFSTPILAIIIGYHHESHPTVKQLVQLADIDDYCDWPLQNRVESALTEPTLSHHGTCDVAYRGFRLMFNKTLS
ncbi:MAG: hypothetical protein GY821_07625 [Gammaproteobacteria bacterium]|nr:hypothetical protein [Gammaproteobacteria bacterium]